MPTLIYDRDNPKGRPANAGDTSSGVILYAVDPYTNKVEATLDGRPILAPIVQPEAPPVKAAVEPKPKRAKK